MGAGTTPHSNAGASTSDRNGHTMPLQNTPTTAGTHSPDDEREPNIRSSYTVDEPALDDPTYDSQVPEDERRLLPEAAPPSSPQQPYTAGSPMQRARPSSTTSQQRDSEDNTTQTRFSRVQALFSRSSTTPGSGRGGQVGSGQGHSSVEHVSLNMGHDPNHSGDNESDDRRCRICLESDDDPDSEQGHLISPCLCKGSARYIHLGCLQQWREASPRKESAFSCDTCHYRYSFSRPWMAKVLGNESFLHIVTTLMVLIMIYLCGWVGHGLESSGVWHWKSILTEYPPASGPTLILGLDGWDYVWGLIMSAILGLLFLVISLCFLDVGGMAACGACGDGCAPCYIGDCAVGGQGAEFILIFAAIIMFFFGIFGAFAGVYRLAAKFNKQALDSMRETILEVK